MQLLASVQSESSETLSHVACQQAQDGINLFSATALSPAREQLETFIANGFATAFEARIHHFLPLLVGIKTTGIRAALGIRSARQPLFVEQYLDTTVEQALQQSNIAVSRERIVEIGNLFSASSRYTLPLLLAVSTALYVNGTEYLVFSATAQLSKLFRDNRLDLTWLANADESRLTPSHDTWGSYYDTAPQVLALNTGDVIRLMLQQPALLNLYSQLADQMPAFNQQVRCLS